MAIAMLPLDASTTSVPGFNRPAACAALSIENAGRSLRLMGFINSSLATTRVPLGARRVSA